MNFQIPKSIVENLKDKYKDSHVESILKDFLNEIIDYCINYSICTIPGFGKFVMYKTHCGRTSMIRPRFKFRYSRSLLNKIYNDSFIMEKLRMSTLKHEFNEKNEENCKDKRDIRDANAKLMSGSNKVVGNVEQERQVSQFINKLITEDLETLSNNSD